MFRPALLGRGNKNISSLNGFIQVLNCERACHARDSGLSLAKIAAPISQGAKRTAAVPELPGAEEGVIEQTACSAAFGK